MMRRNFRLRSELSGAKTKRLPHAKNQLSAPGIFFNQFVIQYIYASGEHKVSASRESLACEAAFMYIQYTLDSLNLANPNRR